MKISSIYRAVFFVFAAALTASGAAQSSVSKHDVVTIQATTPLATEPDGQAGEFTISRFGPTNDAVTIPYRVAGSATNGVDYAQIPLSVTLAAGQSATNILISPVSETATHHKTVVLTIVHHRTNDFSLGYPDSAKVFIVYNYTNIAPDVKIVAPTNGSEFLSMPNIDFAAEAGDSNGWVTSVEFFTNGSSIGTVTNFAPGPTPLTQLLNREEHHAAIPVPGWPLHERFEIIWSNVPPGAYALTAVAMDNAGLQTTSAPVNINVSTNLPTPTTKILSPPNDAVFLNQTPINILAEAGESGGAINTVEFFGNNASLGTVTNSVPVAGPHPSPLFLSWRPYFFRWTNDIIGSNTIYTIATDANGSQATSAVVSINVLTNFPRHHPW